jgi:hypothetical protein
MRALTMLASVLAFAATGCGNGASGDDMAAPDLSASSVLDMTAANDDLSTLSGCHGLEMCLAGCKGSTGCQMTCRMNATMAGRRLAKMLNDCRQATCFVQDGGAEPCMAGVPASAACMLCQKDADTAPGMCAAGGMPSWCGACYQQFSACQSDLP